LKRKALGPAIASLPMLVPVTAIAPTDRAAGESPVPSFQELYGEHFSFVWRTLWRLGVTSASLADATQDVFVVIHRRLADLQSTEVARSWVYGIVVRVAHDYRRASRRRGADAAAEPDQLADGGSIDAHARLELGEAVATLAALLETLRDDRREVLVLAELEQLTVPEIAQLLGANVNTVYTRLRAARQDFERSLTRHRARTRRLP
jgi:RNA polymerase sigma-70 factor, ECF subfamily